MDTLVKAMALDDNVRVYIINSTDLVNEAIRRNDTYPSSSDCLGKVLTVTSCMGAMLKGDEELTVKVNGNGPIGNIICDGDSLGVVIGYVDHPHVNFVNNNGGFYFQLCFFILCKKYKFAVICFIVGSGIYGCGKGVKPFSSFKNGIVHILPP